MLPKNKTKSCKVGPWPHVGRALGTSYLTQIISRTPYQASCDELFNPTVWSENDELDVWKRHGKKHHQNHPISSNIINDTSLKRIFQIVKSESLKDRYRDTLSLERKNLLLQSRKRAYRGKSRLYCKKIYPIPIQSDTSFFVFSQSQLKSPTHS